MRPLRALPAAALVVIACGSSTSDGTVRFVWVDDPFTGPPAATTVDVDAVDPSTGAGTSLVRGASLAGASVDLGSLDATKVAAFRAQARDAAGDVVAWGESVPVTASSLAGGTLSLFIQRTGALARFPGALGRARSAPLLEVVSGEYVLVAGGDLTTDLYDLGPMAPLSSPPSLARAPLSLAVVGLEALAIDAGGASWLDLTSSATGDATLPAGGAWSDVAGGATVTATNGTAYVVGGTRASGAPTARVLVVSSAGALSFASMSAPRLGAAAAWVEGRGLVVAGGSATAAGVEVLAAGATSASALPYPADATTGGGMDVVDGSHVILAGGSGSPMARTLDLACSASCAASSWSVKPATDLPVAQAFSTGASAAVVVGEDASGASHVFSLSPGATMEIPFKVPRNHARALRLPSGAVVIAGGDVTMEELAP